MGTKLAIVLKVTRRVSGLTQHDLAILLGVDRTVISKLERGRWYPTGEQVALLCIIYGHSSLPIIYEKSRPELIALLATRIQAIRVKQRNAARTTTINSLNARLITSSPTYD